MLGLMRSLGALTARLLGCLLLIDPAAVIARIMAATATGEDPGIGRVEGLLKLDQLPRFLRRLAASAQQRWQIDQ